MTEARAALKLLDEPAADTPPTPARPHTPRPSPAKRTVAPAPAKTPNPPVDRPQPTVVPGDGEVRLSKAQRAILSALAPYAPGTRNKVQVALLTGYSHKGGGFANALGSLRSAGYIEGGGDGMRATLAGLDALGEYIPLPTGAALREHWYAQLGKAPRMILEALADAHPHALTKDEVAEATGYEASGGGFANALGKLRTLELIRGPGSGMVISDDLME